MRHYVLSSNAQKSLKEIKKYSTEQFGKRQTSLYLEKLRNRMQTLSESPKYGKARDKIKAGYYSYLEGSHMIYYKILKDHIAIIDILHRSMEPERHLLGED